MMRFCSAILRLIYVSLSIFVLGTLFISCAKTQYIRTSPSAIVLNSGAKCLVPHLPDRYTDYYLKDLTTIFERKNIDIKYFPQEEWNLRVSGVIDPLDSMSFSKLQKAGYTHLLVITELMNKSGDNLTYYTPPEVENRRNSSYRHDTSNQSKISMQLIPLSDVRAAHTVIASTRISSIGIRGKHGGETRVNPTSVNTARFKAMRKAAARMLEQCSVQ